MTVFVQKTHKKFYLNVQRKVLKVVTTFDGLLRVVTVNMTQTMKSIESVQTCVFQEIVLHSERVSRELASTAHQSLIDLKSVIMKHLSVDYPKSAPKSPKQSPAAQIQSVVMRMIQRQQKMTEVVLSHVVLHLHHQRKLVRVV
jgi:hypothetical protein